MKLKIFDNQDIDIYDYIAIYFWKSKKIIEKYLPNNIVLLQFFQRKDNIKLCGIKHSLKIVKKYGKNINDLQIFALKDGDIINSNEAVLTIKGKYQDFGYLEGIIDGILCKETTISNNTFKIKNVSNNKEIIYMNDRADWFFNQEFEGYAANIAGITNFVNQSQVSLIKNNNYKVLGTIPHALIQNFEGDLIKTIDAYSETFPQDNLVALVDYNNDVIKDSLKAAKRFPKLYAVRVDTSMSIIDKSLSLEDIPEKEKYGVNKHLIFKLRKELDKEGYKKIKIIVSSGFDAKKISYFEKNNVPVDIYGVGQAFSQNKIFFTGDCVELNDKSQSKFGRNIYNNNKMRKININEVE